MHRHQALLLTLALSLLAGCASTPHHSTDLAVAPSSSAPSSNNSLAPQPPLAVLANSPAAPLSPVQLETNALQTVDLTAHADDVWDRIRTGFAIPNMNSPLVVEQQAWYLSHQDFLQRAVERSSHYLYHVVVELEKRHMPTELALLPFIESAYNPMAYSRAHASGMWQFIPTTGKDYNLQQDWWRDERRDVVASTDAALNYLQALYEMHGDWTLALASYNWGEGAVKRAIERNAAANQPTDYLSLNMPEETRSYYPKLQALKNIIANPAAFGVVLPRIDNQPYFVSVPHNRDMDMKTAARLAGMQLDDFKALNPSFNRPVISHSAVTTLLIPADRAAAFQSNLEGIAEPLTTWSAYTVRRGERLDRIAARFGMTVSALCEANSLPTRARLRPGQALLVENRGAGARIVPASMDTAPSPLQDKMVRVSYSPAPTQHRLSAVYVVHGGDTLFSIARRFNTTVDAIRAQNHLGGRQIDSGERLVIPATLVASSQWQNTKSRTH